VSETKDFAPGAPGIEPRWTSSAKSGVGTALSGVSRVWFTLSHGILNEVFFPRVDQACTRDMGLVVTADGFFSEEKRHAASVVRYIASGVPAYRLVNTCARGRYRIEKEIIADPCRDVVLQRTRFTALSGALEIYRLYVLLSPHVGNGGGHNTAWVGDYKGVPMLFAERGGSALALACSAHWLARSAGFVGVSDGWQQLRRDGELAGIYTRAEDGNVALTGQVDLADCGGDFVLALGFGQTPAEAGQRARASLLQSFDSAMRAYTGAWRNWQEGLLHLEEARGAGESAADPYRVSAMVLRTHESKRFPGGIIASLSIPWGFSKGDDDLGGYHLVWPRDLVETAGGLLALGAGEDALRVLEYLRATQEDDGHWAQNMWMDGSPYWGGVQLDETAFPILLADMARREGPLGDGGAARYWPMVRAAAAFVVQNGPVTQQDRWEEDPGYSPFTLAVEIAALLAAADMADAAGEPQAAAYLRETADNWNASIERWIYVRGTDLAERTGVDGYYVRIAPPETSDACSTAEGFVAIKNRPPGQSLEAASHIVSPDALALVRFGLRAPDDPRIVNTVKVIDALLKVETPAGPCWHRYNNDGYGEHEDGGPFDGTGVGRAWPLLAGERAHYELAAGRADVARALLATMEAFASDGSLLPEQVWDAPDIPERELRLGRPSGSAMPLVWAHSEHVKLLRSLRDGCVFDMPPQTAERYARGGAESPFTIWRFNHRCRRLAAGTALRVETLAPATVHWSDDGWKTAHDTRTHSTGLGVHVADLPTNGLEKGRTVVFTFHWSSPERWEDADFEVAVA